MRAVLMRKISFGSRDTLYYFDCPEIAKGAKPGQFVEVRVSEGLEPFLRRPISIFNTEENTLTLLVRTAGKGTRRMSSIPVVCKLTTDCDGFCESAKTAEGAGVQAIYTANTPIGMAIDIRTGKTCTGMIKAPINGPAIKPIGIARTFDLYRAVKIPIIASGGICCTEDAVEYMMAGASAVGIGAYNFVVPDIAVKVIKGLEEYMDGSGYETISQITGLAALILDEK